MALTERATWVLATINGIIENNDLSPKVSINDEAAKVFVYNPKNPKECIREEIIPPSTPFMPLYSSKSTTTESAPISKSNKVDPKSKSEVFNLLKEIKSKIAEPNSKYLEPGSAALSADIMKIDDLLSLKFTEFQAMANDFIKLVGELKFILIEAEWGSNIFERHVEEKRNTRLPPQKKTEIEEEEEEEEPSSWLKRLNPFPKCCGME